MSTYSSRRVWTENNDSSLPNPYHGASKVRPKGRLFGEPDGQLLYTKELHPAPKARLPACTFSGAGNVGKE